MNTSDKDIVREGYERIAEAYLATRGSDGADMELLRDFADRLAEGASVLDAGCGSGVPVARYLSAERGFDVTGVDFAAAQIELARRHVPSARFVQADIASLAAPGFPEAAFDGICSYYTIIHVPRAEHPGVLANFLRMLRPGGLLLFSTGYGESDDDVEDDWLGASMYWSHFGREDNLKLVADAGFDLVWERTVQEDEEFGGGCTSSSSHVSRLGITHGGLILVTVPLDMTEHLLLRLVRPDLYDLAVDDAQDVRAFEGQCCTAVPCGSTRPTYRHEVSVREQVVDRCSHARHALTHLLQE